MPLCLTLLTDITDTAIDPMDLILVPRFHLLIEQIFTEIPPLRQALDLAIAIQWKTRPAQSFPP